MSKTTVTNIIDDIKVLSDYNITDSDLDTLILKAINLVVKRMKQWFMDEGLWDEITAHDTFTTTADQEYVDIAAETVDFDQNIKLTERDNDSPIEIISFKEYRETYSNPSSSKSNTPDVAAFFANRLYLGPTPSGVITLYLDYVKLITKLTSSDSLPYEDKYDEVVINGVIWYLVKWLDRTNRTMIVTAKEDFLESKDDLIVKASKNIGENRQIHSRRESIPYFSPRKVTT